MAIIRKANIENFEKLRELAIKIFTETFEAENNPADFKIYMEEAFSAEKIKSEYSEEGSQYFEALEDGQLVGYARIRQNNEADPYLGKNHIELMRFYVDSPWQGKGIAKQMLTACEAHTQQLGKEWIWLGVWEHNLKAQRFYKKHGYEKFSEHAFMVGHDEQTDWLMKKKLNP